MDMSHPLEIRPLSSSASARWQVPGSKSLTNRALILAALAPGTSILEGVLHSDDTRHMRDALTQMGATIKEIGPTSLLIKGGANKLSAPNDPIFVGNSGTTVRFLTALAALITGTTTLVGDKHMAKRPIADLCDALAQIGVEISCPTGCPPIHIHGGSCTGGQLSIRGDKSSQYLSALLMAGSLADSDLEITVEGELVSRPYIDMTIRLITDFGGRVTETAQGFHVHRCHQYNNRSLTIEPDASAASYPFAFAAAGGGTITVPHLNGESLQGDYRFVDILTRMGASVEKTPHYTRVSATKQLHGVDVDMFHVSDTVMTLAAIAPLCKGPTTIRNVANIRIKETDRLIATVNELQRLGQQVEHGDDWLRITPQPITPAVIECYSDHRIAMSFGILGMLAPGMTIADPACVSKTYPDFWEDVKKIYTAAGESCNW